MKYLYSFILFCLTSLSFGQEIEWVVKPEVESLEMTSFSEDVAVVMLNYKLWLLDKNAKLTQIENFHTINTFFNNRCKVSINNKFGFINKKGKVAVPLVYDFIRDMRIGDKVIVAMKGKKWGCVDLNGEIVVSFENEAIEYFFNGFFSVKQNGKYSIIDVNGNVISNEIFDEVRFFSGNRCWVKKDNKWGAIDEKGNLKIPYLYASISQDFSSNVSVVIKENKFILVDTVGNQISDSYSRIDIKSNDGICQVKANDKWGLINYSGLEVIKPNYMDIGLLSFGVIPVEIGSKWGLIDRKGVVVVPPNYDKIDILSSNSFLVEKNNKYGVINRELKVLVPFEYTYERCNNNIL